MSVGTRLVLILASIAMIAAVLGGLHVLGNPAHQRDLRLDSRRTLGLYQISNSIHHYWIANHALPVDLSTMDVQTDWRSDPVTGEPYTYKRLSDESYSLCANFSGASQDAARIESMPNMYMPTGPAWTHPAGSYCFRFKGESEGMPER
jgi:hypothetical protein